ncbi:MAG: hypothetical protein JWS12_519 [Candidatus Saccharibacteria bacterium]|nr:hypothetical protein [Candidatus Saccharibacteria bacterium]
MSLPFSLHGNQYLEHLRVYRDAALVESHWMGRRKRLGRFTFGTAYAQWQTEEGGAAHLIDQGLRNGTSPLTLKPTILRLLHHPGETGIEVVTFKMDIDDIGCIDIYRNMVISGSFREMARIVFPSRVDDKLGLSQPTDDDRELLYKEMQRGATGLHPIDYSSEIDE